MPQALVYLNHGGQNSVMTGLIYGVPQIIFPGNIFERQYNAASIEQLKAGLVEELGSASEIPINTTKSIPELTPFFRRGMSSERLYH